MKALKLAIDEFTTPSPLTANVSDSVETVKKLMKEKSVRHIPIESDGEVVGLISDRDIKAISLANSEHIKAETLMSEDIFTTLKGAPLEEVVFEMSKRKIGSAVVTENDGSLYGIFTSTDALNALVEILRGDF